MVSLEPCNEYILTASCLEIARDTIHERRTATNKFETRKLKRTDKGKSNKAVRERYPWTDQHFEEPVPVIKVVDPLMNPFISPVSPSLPGVKMDKAITVGAGLYTYGRNCSLINVSMMRLEK